MNVFTVFLMIIAAGVMIFGLQKSKQGVPWGRPLTIGAALVALLLALGNMIGGGGPSPDKLRRISERFRAAAGTKLGQHLAENYRGDKALLLMPQARPGTEGPKLSEYEQVFVDALRDALEGGVTIAATVTPEPPPEVREQYEEMLRQMRGEESGEVAEYDKEMMYEAMPMYEWFTAERLDTIVRQHKDECDLLIAVCELPPDLFNARFWRSADPPKVAVTSGNVYSYFKAIQADAIVAAIAHNPNATFEEKAPKDVDKAFAERYLLVTPENVATIADEHPNLFERD